MSWLYRPTNDLCQQFMQQPNAHVCRLPTNFDFFFTLPFDKSLLENMNPYELHCFYVFLHEILIDVAKTMGRPGVDNIFSIQRTISERLIEIKRLKPSHMKEWMQGYGTPIFDDDEKLVAFQQEAESTRFGGDPNLTGPIPFHPESFNESKPYIGWHNYENQNFEIWRGGKLELICMYGGIFRNYEEWRREESNLTKRQLEILQKGDVKMLNWMNYGHVIYEGRPIAGLDNARVNPFLEDFSPGWQAAVRRCYTPMAIEARRRNTELRIEAEPPYRVTPPNNDETRRTSEATNDSQDHESLERQDDEPTNEAAQLLRELYATLVKIGVSKEEARQTVVRAALFNLPDIAGRTTIAPSAREYTLKRSQDTVKPPSCYSSQTTIELNRPSRTQITARAPHPAHRSERTPQQTGPKPPVDHQNRASRSTTRQVPLQPPKPTQTKPSFHPSSLHEPRKAPSSPSTISTKAPARDRTTQPHVSCQTIPLRPSRYTAAVPGPRYREPTATRDASTSTRLLVPVRTASRVTTGTDGDGDETRSPSPRPKAKKRAYQAYAVSSSETSARSEGEGWRDVYA